MGIVSRGKQHDLKTWPEHWDAVYRGWKTFELRKDDRGGFEVGDTLALHEYWPGNDRYTGRVCFRRVTHVLQGGQFGLEQGYVALSLSAEA